MFPVTQPKVLLIGWDAADWKVITPLADAGKMPNVRRLIENGATGPIATLHPPLSPMLWTSIATGKRPFKHGIHGFTEPTADGLGIQPVTNLSRRTKALWNILTRNGLRSAVIGWWPSHPAEPIDGVMVSDHYQRASQPLDKGWPLLNNAVHPPELAATLADLRMHPDLLTAEMVEPFIPLAREIDQERDGRLAACMKTLGECLSIHAAATWLLDHPLPDGKPWDLFAVYYDAIDHFCHGFMRYHPPRQSWVGERDFELYSNVVNRAYQFHDEMLGVLLRKAGYFDPDQNVTVILVSDHGFHPDHLRPSAIPEIPAGPAIEHRDFGILAIGGPGIRENLVIHGASVLDVTPTILTLFDLPVGEDMDGRVLTQAFVREPELRTIASWDEAPGADGSHPPHTRVDPVAAHEALEQMIALGYIERPDSQREVAVEKTLRELRYNLGEAYQDDDRHLEAYEIFRELWAKDPDEQRFAVRLFVSCQALGMTEMMNRIVDDLGGRRRELYEEAVVKVAGLRAIAHSLAQERKQAAEEEEKEEEEKDIDSESLLDAGWKEELAKWKNLARYVPPVVDYLRAQVLTAEKRYAEALASLEKVTAAHMVRPGLLLQSADLYLRLRRFREAETVYRKALAIDSDQASAYMGICRVELRRRRFGAAADAALHALNRVYHSPLAHYLLGVALAGMKEYDRAVSAFYSAISFNPNFPEAHLRLAALLEKHSGDADAARQHRRLAREMRRTPIGLRARRAPVAMAEGNEHAAGAMTSGAVESPPLSEAAPLEETLVVVTGLPRSGTSMLMQMLAAGGFEIMTDGLREPDEDNPRGYLEFEPVKNLLKDSSWLREGRGKAVKIVAPLLGALPPGLPCRVIFIERDLDEVLESQQRMLARRKQEMVSTPERRQRLKDEYARTVLRIKAALERRPHTRVLCLDYRDAVTDPRAVAKKMSDFLGSGLDTVSMAASVDPVLHRNRSPATVAGPR